MQYEYQPTCQIPIEKMDQIFAEAFLGRREGCLVEIGAHDGWHWSCTWGLAKIGWRALYVEPVPELFAECVQTHKNHPNTKVVQCCIGAEDKAVEMGMGEYGASLCKDYCNSDRIIPTQQYKLDTFLAQHDIPVGFELLLIDVEGAEDQVLAGFDSEKWRPRMIIIERPPKPNKLEAIYDEIYSDWINTIYKRKS